MTRYNFSTRGVTSVTWPLFWELNATCSNAVKGTDFKFNVHVFRDSPNMTLYNVSEKGAWPESRDLLKFTWHIYVHILSPF